MTENNEEELLQMLDNSVEIWQTHFNRAQEYFDKASARLEYAKLRRDTYHKKHILLPEKAAQ